MISYTQNMTKIKFLFSLCFLFLVGQQDLLLAQEEVTSSTEKPKTLKETFREATIRFNEGYPKDVIRLLTNALQSHSAEKGKSQKAVKAARAVREDAYELLTTAYLFLKQEENADTTFLKLLATNPAYIPKGEDVAPDLIYFAEGFVTYPWLSIGVKYGSNFTNAQVLNTYTTGNNATTDETYGSSNATQIGLHINYALTKNVLALVFEPTFSNRKFNFSEHLQSIVPNSGEGGGFVENALIDIQEEQFWLDLPVLLRASLGSTELKFYVEAGFAANLLLRADFNEIRTGNETDRIDLIKQSMRKTFNSSILGGVGIMYRAKLNYFTIGIQYQNMLQNLVNPESRFANNELIYKFGLIENDFTISSLGINIGFVKPFYASKKRKNFHFIEP